MTLWQKARSYLHGAPEQAAEQPRTGQELDRVSREASGTGTAQASKAPSQAVRRSTSAAFSQPAQQPSQVMPFETYTNAVQDIVQL